MERKVYRMENLGCANCAAKMEAKFNALPEVAEARVVFATKQLWLQAEAPDQLIGQLEEIARGIEPDVRIRAQVDGHSHHHHEKGCACGHDHGHSECGCGHHHEHGACGCGHNHEHHGHHEHHEHHEHHSHGGNEKREILLGTAAFVLSFVLRLLGWNLPANIGFVAAFLVLGRPILAAAWKNAFRGHVLDENFLMSIATIGAFCIGEFPEAAGVMLFYRIGEFFEHSAVEKSRSQIMDAVDLRPETVNLVTPEGISVIPAADARVGDLLLVRPGDRIPLDGVVVAGESRLDTAPITGEPVPVRVGIEDTVISGCINTTGQLTIRAEKVLEESMVSRILSSVENAAASKPKIERFITRFARIYTPVVVAIAAAVAVIPSAVTGNWGYWVYTALSFLVMSCPCALVLSVPLAFFSGIGAGSRKGILFKGGVSMEALSSVQTVVMDKTGTLTQGNFKVQKVDGGEELLRIAASCEQHSTHPIAVSIVQRAREQNLRLEEPEALEEIPGRGIWARLDGNEILCGNEALLTQRQIALPEETRGVTRVLVAVNGQFVGCLEIADTLKSGAKDAILRLHKAGLVTAMLTGDNQETAREIARQTGIREVYAKLLPDEKLQRLKELREKFGPAMFVGDGINDAPVLAGADVGAAMGSGADAAIEAADVVFMTSDPLAIPDAVAIARQTKTIAWQNVVFALAVKAVVMALGLMGFASMWMAVFADSGVAMLCVLNSVRLLYGKREKQGL